MGDLCLSATGLPLPQQDRSSPNLVTRYKFSRAMEERGLKLHFEAVIEVRSCIYYLSTFAINCTCNHSNMMGIEERKSCHALARKYLILTTSLHKVTTKEGEEDREVLSELQVSEPVGRN